MRTIGKLTGALMVAATTALSAPAASSDAQPADSRLLATIMALDWAAFDAFNHCSAPDKLRKHADYFSQDVEFYHDTGGVTWSRQEMLANTEKYVCGKFRRELIPGSVRVYPVKDFGAIEMGSHRFCQFASGNCDGLADFTIVWSKQGGDWKITRVLSYGHRSSK